jgi:hypothetical protein
MFYIWTQFRLGHDKVSDLPVKRVYSVAVFIYEKKLTEILTCMTVMAYFTLTLLKTNTELHYIERSSSYRAVNTLRLSYTNQSVNVVQSNNRCLF